MSCANSLLVVCYMPNSGPYDDIVVDLHICVFVWPCHMFSRLVCFATCAFLAVYNNVLV